MWRLNSSLVSASLMPAIDALLFQPLLLSHTAQLLWHSSCHSYQPDVDTNGCNLDADRTSCSEKNIQHVELGVRIYLQISKFFHFS